MNMSTYTKPLLKKFYAPKARWYYCIGYFFLNLNQSEYRVVNQQTVTACLTFSDIYIVAVTAETKTVEIWTFMNISKVSACKLGS